jgi:ABC-type dipeptide/oligopeptide/nickel transport system permease subunit
MSAAGAIRARPLLPSVDLVPPCFLGLVLLVAIAAPLIAPYDPLAQNLDHALELPSAAHLLGTDDLGRDLMSRLMLGTRVSVEVGFGSALVALVFGTSLGLFAGYQSGFVSATVMRLSDVLLAFPAVLLAMLVATVLKTGLIGVILAIAVVSVPTFVRLANAVMLAERHLQYVEAAVAFGASRYYVIFRAVLPNVLAPLAVQTAFTIANAALLEAGLSFLGLGIQPLTPSLGLMLQDARGYLRGDAWFGICPGMLIILIVLALNAAADGIGRRVDPRRVARRTRQTAI